MKETCHCKEPETGIFICWKCNKSVHEKLTELDRKYLQYDKLCDRYGEEIALRLVYG